MMRQVPFFRFPGWAIFAFLTVFPLNIGAAGGISLVFLGVESGDEPLLGRQLTQDIHWRLAADSTLDLEAMTEVEKLLSTGALKGPVPNAYELKGLGKRLNRQYAAYGRLKKVRIETKRMRWMPWRMKVIFSQELDLRLADIATGDLRISREVKAEWERVENTLGAYPPWNRLDPRERHLILEALEKKLASVAAGAIHEVLLPAPEQGVATP